MRRILLFAIGLTIGNFIWQGVIDRHWMTAIEHSYYQTMALVLWQVFSSR